MAYVITNQKPGYLKSFQVDSREDTLTLPVAPETALGSDCLVIEDSSIWLLNSENEWQELGAG